MHRRRTLDKTKLKFMKTYLFGFFAFALVLLGCEKAEKCDSIGCWGDDSQFYHIFVNEDIDFYCYNGPTALGIAKDKNSSTHKSDLLQFAGYPYYDEIKGEGSNQQFHSTEGTDGFGVFSTACSENRENKNRIITYIFIENYDLITSETKELTCRLELWEEYAIPLHYPHTVIDSSVVIFKRAEQ